MQYTLYPKHQLNKQVVKKVQTTARKWLHTLIKQQTKPSIHGHYKCKINNEKAHIVLKPEVLEYKTLYCVTKVPYKVFKNVKLQVKWWRIRVQLETKRTHYNFDFASMHQAQAFYEKLVYKKIENTL